MLCSRFSDSEILDVVNRYRSSKGPGLDGFNFHFIKNNWDTIGIDLTGALHCFYDSGYILRRCNVSFITLIPKRKNPSTMNDYRLISLVGCMYKVIVNILANGLKVVLSNVIDKQQVTFLSGRGLLDSVLVANEIIDYFGFSKKHLIQ